MPEFTIAELAHHIGGEAVGEVERRVSGVAPLETAGADDLSFVASRKYLPYVAATRAAAVLVSPELSAELPLRLAQIRTGDPHAALGAVIPLFHPVAPPAPGIHGTAVVEDDVEMGEDVSVGAFAVIGRGARLGPRARVGAHVVVGAGCVVGEDAVLHPHATLYPGVRIGRRSIIHSGARLGSDGFGYVFVDGEHRKVPQVGGCRIGDDVEIGANTTIDRGSIGETVVGDGTKIDNLVQLGHNVRVGEKAILISQVGVSGSTTIGAGAVLGGQVGVVGHVNIGAGARVGAQGGVTADVPAGETVSGYPARPHREALRAQAALFRLPALMRRVQEMERAVFGRRRSARESTDDRDASA